MWRLKVNYVALTNPVSVMSWHSEYALHYVLRGLQPLKHNIISRSVTSKKNTRPNYMKNIKLLGKKSYWSQQLFFFTLPAHPRMASLEEQLTLSGQLNSNTQRCHFSILRNIINKQITASCHRLPNYCNNNPFLPKLRGRSSQH